jgi:hypothetical protein
LDPETLGKQCRLALNRTSRTVPQVLEAAAVKWDADEHRLEKNAKRKERSDKGQNHKKKQRHACVPNYLREKDVERLSTTLVEMGADLGTSASEDENLVVEAVNSTFLDVDDDL